MQLSKRTLVALLICLSITAYAGQRPAAQRQRWEHKVVSPCDQGNLSGYGHEGWELVDAEMPGLVMICWFKRPAP